MKFITAQNGARRGYAVPSILARAGMLERFYTDICADVGLGKIISQGKLIPGIGKQIERLANRRLPAELLSYTKSFGTYYFQGLLREKIAKDETLKYRADTLRSLAMGRAMAKHGFGKASHLYMMLTEFPTLMKAARESGLSVVSEVYILISTERILAEERRAFPNWDPMPADFDSIRRELLSEDVLFTQTDRYICPSLAVRDDLVRNWGVEDKKAAVVPYGMNKNWLQLKSQPQRGRVLFVGTADLRKGIHYLALAAEKLHSRGHDYEFRIAGDVRPSVLQQPVCRHLTFLGRVPRNKIADEFAKADVFVLPSLAEGSAEVTYEALAAGVPVITTHASGSVTRDNIDGIIVPERSVDDLAIAIEQVIESRVQRENMSLAARERAREYTWENYGDRLLEVLRS